MQGHSDPDDPLFGSSLRGPTPIEHVRIIQDGETITVGQLAMVAYFTPGHTPGGTSWTWKSCEQARCLSMVYADSLSAVSSERFRYSHSSTYPRVLQDFAKSFEILSTLPCDILLTAHPEFSDTLGRLQKRDSGANPDAFIDSNACRQYAEASRFVAEVDGAVAGFTDLEPDGHLNMMYVHAEFQGRGMASALLSQLEAVARRQGLELIYTEASITARTFFERRGFELIAQQVVSTGGREFSNFRMRKSQI